MKNAIYEEIDRLNYVLDAHITVLAAVRADNKVLAALNDTFPEEIIRLEEEIERLKAEVKEKDAENEDGRLIILEGLDRTADVGDSLRVLGTVAVNGIYWRDEQIAALKAEATRDRVKEGEG